MMHQEWGKKRSMRMKSPVNLGNSGSINENTGPQKTITYKLFWVVLHRIAWQGKSVLARDLPETTCGAVTQNEDRTKGLLRGGREK